MLNAQIIRANQVELAQREYMAEHAHAIRELRGSSPRHGKQLKHLAIAAVSVAFLSGGADAVAATNARVASTAHESAGRTGHYVRTTSEGAGARRFFRLG